MRKTFSSAKQAAMLAVVATIACLMATPVAANHNITFHDIAADGGTGISYERTPSVTVQNAEAIQNMGTVVMTDFTGPHPIKSHGAPGVALLDFDDDGDLDIYVTNGPATPNSLFANQLVETGEIGFVDIGVQAGVAATHQDSTGVCFGDIDNDGDEDLYVLGRQEDNLLFENLGNGAFVDITGPAGVGGGALTSMSCSMGDVDGDGLLDILVGNTFDMASSDAIFNVPFALNQRDQLFVNAGGNTFVDRSVDSGVALDQEITWAVALVDIDQDGDTDFVRASDNGAIPFASVGGLDRGFVRVLENDGSGHFTDASPHNGLLPPGDWMGLAFADFDHNGALDIFASNSGDWFEEFFGLPVSLGDQATRWFLQNPDGTFVDPGVGDLVATPFGWGTAAFDHDHDGDTDVVFFGGLDAGPIVECSNPGTLLENDGSASFQFDANAFSTSAVDHTARVEHGLAVGDLNGDGFGDIVSVSNLVVPSQPVQPVPFPIDHDSAFDGLADFFPTFLPGPSPGQFVFSGAQFLPGLLAVELSSGNGNGWVEVRTVGSTGLTDGGAVNRSGIGAVVKVTPHGGETAIVPITGGSSYASQHSLARQLGLGSAPKAAVEVLWPGGVRNRLYDVRPGERVVFPEIPCSIDADQPSGQFLACTRSSLDDLVDAGVISRGERARFLGSAARAFQEEHR